MRTDVERHPVPRTDPRLNWRPAHDPKSRQYGIMAATEEVEEVPKMWDHGVVLDQGYEGACVGFGWTAELLASPRPDRTATEDQGNKFALGAYREAKVIDEWPGEDYDGTSVLAGAKIIQEKGLMDEYRWCFGIDEVVQAVITQGPVVIGIPWYEQMYETRPSGLVEVGGKLVGGHCITLIGYHPNMRINGEPYANRYRVFRWVNSWGTSYGKAGTGLIKYDDLASLLSDNGEACVPMGRKRVRIKEFI